jgi:hypothetical protein
VREFKVLKKLRDGVVGRVLGEWKNPSEAKKPTHFQNSLFISPIRDVLSPGKDNLASGYEATGIWSTRDSILWAWRRVREYLNDWFDPIDGTKEAYALMRS